MRKLGNALVWVGLTVGLPSVLYAMTMASKVEESGPAKLHQPNQCAVCRHFREMKEVPLAIDEDSMILVSPGHQMAADYDE
jgi:hypothetical protein